MKPLKAAFFSSLITLLIASAAFAYLFYTQGDQIANGKPLSNERITGQPEQNNFVKTSDTQIASASIGSERQNIITRTVQKVSPAVVGINVKEIRQYRSPWSADPFFRQFFGDRVYNREINGLGSGAIISEDGYILTNDHVAGNAVEIIVTMTDGTQHPAKLVGTDDVSDIALLKIDADNLPHIDFGNSDDILIGEWSIALGNPFGLFNINDKPTVTVGVVSATGMNLGKAGDRYYLSMIQTDAAINSGNSGGPLVNSLGELIGMNTLIYTAGGSSGSVGVGFAIPVNKIQKIIDELKTKGKVDRDFWTGLRIQTVDEGIARYYDLPNTRGVIITHVAENSPADNAGLETGDIILEVDKFLINDDETMIGVLHEFRAGENINIKVLRNDEIINKTMKLEKRK